MCFNLICSKLLFSIINVTHMQSQQLFPALSSFTNSDNSCYFLSTIFHILDQLKGLDDEISEKDIESQMTTSAKGSMEKLDGCNFQNENNDAMKALIEAVNMIQAQLLSMNGFLKEINERMGVITEKIAG